MCNVSEVDNALIDLAIDGSLAKSLFHTISAANCIYAIPLECLTLRVEAFGAQGGWGSRYDLIKLLQYIGHSWTCTGTLRDDRPHECELEEYDQEDQLDRDYMDESVCRSQPPYTVSGQKVAMLVGRTSGIASLWTLQRCSEVRQ